MGIGLVGGATQRVKGVLGHGLALELALAPRTLYWAIDSRACLG